MGGRKRGGNDLQRASHQQGNGKQPGYAFHASSSKARALYERRMKAEGGGMKLKWRAESWKRKSPLGTAGIWNGEKGGLKPGKKVLKHLDETTEATRAAGVMLALAAARRTLGRLGM